MPAIAIERVKDPLHPVLKESEWALLVVSCEVHEGRTTNEDSDTPLVVEKDPCFLIFPTFGWIVRSSNKL